MRSLLGSLVLATTLLVPVPASATPAGCTTRDRGMPARSTAKWWGRSQVWLYGDSITYQTYDHLRSISDARIGVDAWWGRTTDRAVAVLGNDVHRFRHLPKVVVMASGTNDLDDLPALYREMRMARAVLPKKVQLIWVNLYVDTTQSYNAADRMMSSVPGIRVLSWAAVNRDHRREDGTSTLLLDGIHVNPSGCVARNEMIARAIRKAL